MSLDGPNPLRDLRESLEKAQRNTSTMLTKIQRFEDRLSSIEEEMLPIQNTTATYSRAKENIGLTLSEVEKTYEYFRIATTVDSVVASGFNLQDSQKQKEYFQAVARLTEARTFFETHKREIKSSGSALEQIGNLLKVPSACFNRRLVV